MASIKKNKNGTYTAVVYIGRDNNNKVLRKQITRKGLKECKKAARELEEDIESKSLNNLSIMKMSDYMDKWLEINKAMLAPTTVKAYRIYINKHFKPYFGKLKVNQITDMHIKEYLSNKLSELSSTTVRKHYFTLSKILFDALKGNSPCIGIKPPKNAEYKPVIPTENEFKQIYNMFKSISIEDEAIILLAGWCGLRRGEIFALKWDDLNEDEGTIRIDEAVALEENSYQFEVKEPKSHNGIRTLASPDYLMDLLKEIKSSRDIIQHEIFSQNPHSFTKKYTRILRENKLPKIRFHDLRHYHASLLYKNKVPDLYAAERLGHDIWVLKKIYQHLGLEEKKDLDQQIKNIFK
ncbi:site-specific integrase [Clostridium sp. DL1XJH146]